MYFFPDSNFRPTSFVAFFLEPDSVHCKGDDKINNLDQILKRIAQTIDNIQFDELILENFTQIKMIDFTQIQQVPIKTIRIFDCNHLELLINKNSNKNSTQLAKSLIELELAGNIAIDSDRLFEVSFLKRNSS